MEHSYAEKVFWYHYRIAEQALLLQEPTLWTRIGNLRNFFRSDSLHPNKGQAFLQFYLSTTTDLCIQFLSINILLLLVSIYVITQKHWAMFHLIDLDTAFESYTPAVVDIIIWIIMSIICLGFFIILKWRREWFGSVLLFTDRAVWYEIGAGILAARTLMLIAQCLVAKQTNEKCFDCDILNRPLDNTFGFMFIKMTIDAYQAYAFVILPFPQPWAVGFIGIELIRQEIRLFSCAHRITMDQNSSWVVQLASIILVLLYLSILLVPSIYLEGSLRNRFKGDDLRRQAEEIKQEMVVFLSTDVRVPLQYMLHSIASVEFAELSSSSAQPLLKDIEQHTRTVNDVADDLLLLVRIQEKRYTSRVTSVTDLRSLLDSLVQGVLQRRLAERLPVSVETSPGISTPTNPTAAYRPLRPCFVYTDVPNVEVSVDVKCLLAVVRHLLIFVTQNRDHSPPSTDTASVSFELDLTVDVIDQPGAIEGDLQALRVVLSGDDVTLIDCSEQRRVHEATTAYICNTIAVCCGGTFTSKGFFYSLVLPCSIVSPHTGMVPPENPVSEEEPDANDDVSSFNSVGVSVATNRHSVDAKHRSRARVAQHLHPDRVALEAKIGTCTDMQARFKRNRVCVIVDDSVLESVITSAITTLRLQEGLSILHELQKGDYVPVAKLTFVTSYELCAELRRRRYSGLIVLFSGSINYLDDAQVANLDYSLPLPASDAQLSLFLDWLIEKHDASSLRETARMQQRLARSSSTSVPDRVGVRRRSSAPELIAVNVDPQSMFVRPSLLEVLPVFKQIVQWGYFARDWIVYIYEVLFGEGKSLLVTRLPPGSKESFTKWRWINPSNSWRHQATAQYLTTLPRVLVTLAVQIFLIALPIDLFIAPVILGAIYMLLQLTNHHVLEPIGFKLQYFWMMSNILIDGAHLYATIRTAWLAAPTKFNLSLVAFLATTFDPDTNGGAYVYSQLTLGAYSRLYCMYQTHPLSIIGLLIIFARQSQVLWLVFRTIMSAQMCQFLQLVYVQLLVLNIIYLTYLEDTYRREFKTAHEHILARAFLDQCLDICQHDIRKPLEFLLQRQKDLMQVAVHAGYIRSIKLNMSFLRRLEPLHVAGALLSEMAQELTFIRNNILTVDGNAEPFVRVDHMKSHYSMNSMQLHRAVAGLISSLSSTAESSNVKIYAEVDNKLAVIRVDWKNLSMILTNLVSTALRNIRDFCIETPRNKDLVSYIKIKMVAIDSDAKVPFVHPRVMLINVCDSSNAAAKAAAFSANSRRPSGGRSDPSGNYRRNSDSGSVSEITEQRDRLASQYGRSTCEQLVRKLTPAPVFQTIAVQSVLQTVQRFTFQYHLTPQTRRSQDYIQAETDLPYLTVLTSVAHYFDAYKRIIYPPKVYDKTTGEAAPNKEVIYFTSILVAQRNDVMKLIAQFQWMFWNCTVKYILNIPSMHSVSGADCVLIDYQLEAQEGVNICDTVLKLRVCGFNGVVAVVLQEGLRDCDLIRDELTKSAADVDLIFTGPIRDQNIQAMTVALEKKTVKHLLYMNGN